MTKRRDDIVGRCKKRNPSYLYSTSRPYPSSVFVFFGQNSTGTARLSELYPETEIPSRAASHGISVERAYRKLEDGGRGRGEEERGLLRVERPFRSRSAVEATKRPFSAFVLAVLPRGSFVLRQADRPRRMFSPPLLGRVAGVAGEARQKSWSIYLCVDTATNVRILIC